MHIDWTQIIIHVTGIIASYFFGKRRGRGSRRMVDVPYSDPKVKWKVETGDR